MLGAGLCVAGCHQILQVCSLWVSGYVIQLLLQFAGVVVVDVGVHVLNLVVRVVDVVVGRLVGVGLAVAINAAGLACPVMLFVVGFSVDAVNLDLSRVAVDFPNRYGESSFGSRKVREELLKFSFVLWIGSVGRIFT